MKQLPLKNITFVVSVASHSLSSSLSICYKCMSLLSFLGNIFKEIIVKTNNYLIGICLNIFLSFW